MIRELQRVITEELGVHSRDVKLRVQTVSDSYKLHVTVRGKDDLKNKTLTAPSKQVLIDAVREWIHRA